MFYCWFFTDTFAPTKIVSIFGMGCYFNRRLRQDVLWLGAAPWWVVLSIGLIELDHTAVECLERLVSKSVSIKISGGFVIAIRLDLFLEHHLFCFEWDWDAEKIKVAHTWLPSVGFRSWSRFLADSLQVTWVINPAVGCHYFPSGLQLPSQPLIGLPPILLLGE